jgi:glycosyltransferase involved in cell wall biosynthesis
MTALAKFSNLKREIACRLCGNRSHYRFDKILLYKFNVEYFECVYCHSLQTEVPYWLEEAYGQQAEKLDTGKASRTLENFFLLPSLFDKLALTLDSVFVDWGGGSGLLTRLLRDVGYNYYSYDLYSKSEFSQGFIWDFLERKVSVITAFEVIEHFPNPAVDWEKLLESKPDYCVCSTGIYSGQDENWFYLSPENGQHVFLYSAFALALIASRFGYTVYPIGSYLLFCKKALDTLTLGQLAHWTTRKRENQRHTFFNWISHPFLHAAHDHDILAKGYSVPKSNEIIVIDMLFFQLNNSGIARLWESLLKIWAPTVFGSKLLILDRARTSPRIAGLNYLDIAAYDWNNTAEECENLEKICKTHGAALFLSTYYSRPHATPALLMIYDMIPELMGFDLTLPSWREKHLSIRSAIGYICISKNTAYDLSRLCSISLEKISVAYCGVDSNFTTATATDKYNFQQKYGITKPYFLVVGERGGYKNVGLLFSALNALPNKSEYQIVCMGGRPQMESEYLQLINDLDIVLLRASNEEIHCAYSSAIALVYPSLYEGFGLPVVEAMASGCPVITCPGGSIQEIAEDGVIYVSPTDPEEMARALQTVQRVEIRGALINAGIARAKKYSWKEMADSVMLAINNKKIISPHQTRPKQLRNIGDS